MKLRFKEQEYQSEATKAVSNIFLGQQKVNVNSINMYESDSHLGEMGNIDVIPNPCIQLERSELISNIAKVQSNYCIPSSDYSDLINYSIEMETGTGKTYTYINTMYELYEKYGFGKYIIIVPSVAIREGVYKSLEITSDHFQEKYGHRIKFNVYNSKNPQNILDFTGGSGIQCLVMNFQAFNARGEDARKIFQERDEFGSNRPIDLIKATKPIMIIDEPQKVSEKTEKTIMEEFKPLFNLRYSATHKKDKEYNKLYSLNAVDAYNQKLVKKIEVVGLEIVNDKSEGTYIYVNEISADKTGPYAKIEFEVNNGGNIKKVFKRVDTGYDLFANSNEMQAYKGYKVSEIDARPNQMWIEFTNGVRLHLNEMLGEEATKHMFRAQVRETIQKHLEKEQLLFKKGIKVLSLFFIDKVVNYRDYDQVDAKGELARLFEEVYEELTSQQTLDSDYNEYLSRFSSDQVHNGYFSIDKKGKLIDSKEKKSGKELIGSDDTDAYDLILKNKERLLSFDEPTRFIFSHSALREGWDNPNIFQICTLKESKSEISKRQEIGRGLRICVNQHGDRMDSETLENEFHVYNTLTVIASESYDSFCKDLQEEIAKDLTGRRVIFNKDKLFNKTLINSDGMQCTMTYPILEEIEDEFSRNGYLDFGTNEATKKFKDAISKNNLKVPAKYEMFKESIMDLLNTEVFSNQYKVENASTKNIKPSDFKINDNFYKEEFQALWNKINKKSTYRIEFDSDKLVDNALISLNAIRVPRIQLKKSVGQQKESFTEKQLRDGNSHENARTLRESINEFSHSTVEYDLVGEIKKNTKLMRKTIIKALTSMEKHAFDEYKYNPENFISQVSQILNNEKAKCIVDEIKYFKTDQSFTSEIFIDNKLSGQLGKDVFEANNHIYDFVKVDSKIEQNFMKELEQEESVIVYAKLPLGFKIKTPVGNYNPDWALVIDKDKIRHVYFIAETKGSTLVDALRATERAKIECARKHFAAISNNEIQYDVVDTYEKLLTLIK